MSQVIFDPAIFRQQFPVFANSQTYPDAMVQMYWTMATCYTSDYSWCQFAPDGSDCRRLSLDLLTAHLLFLANLQKTGQTPGFVTSATVDKVSVTTIAPVMQNQWQWWLMGSPYGQQYWALLKVNSVGGFYIGGSPERSAFRTVNGGFPGGNNGVF